VQQQMQQFPDGIRPVIVPVITAVPGSIGQTSIYARARGALTLYSSNMLARNDSSVVVTADNEVAGIAEYAGYGRAYLFPLAFVRDVIARRIMEKKGFVAAGWLGARGDSVAELAAPELQALGLTNPAGVVVRDVAPDGPAAVGGLRPGDVITAVDGFDIAGAADLMALLKVSAEGQRIKIRALRNHEPVDLNALLGARPEKDSYLQLVQLETPLEPISAQVEELIERRRELQQQLAASRDQRAKATSNLAVAQADEALRELEMEIRVFNEWQRTLDAAIANSTPSFGNVDPGPPNTAGFLGKNLTPDLAQLYHVKGGVLVFQVITGSALGAAGLRAGDIIVGTPSQEPISGEDLHTLLSADKWPVNLRVYRNGGFVILTVNKIPK
jgi:S1-C subfamily serine protease